VSAKPAESVRNEPSALQGLNNTLYSALAGLDAWSTLSAGSVRYAHSTDGYSYHAPAGLLSISAKRRAFCQQQGTAGNDDILVAKPQP